MLANVTTLRDPLAQVLGKKASDTFEKVFGLRTVGDLLRHYPRRYYTRGELTPLDSLSEGDHVTVLARVACQRDPGPVLEIARPNGAGRRGRQQRARGHRHRRHGQAAAHVLRAASASTPKQLQQGTIGLFAGTVSSFRGRRQLVHPEYELLPVYAADDRLTTRARRGVRQRADPGLPGERQAELVDASPGSRRRARDTSTPARTRCRPRCAQQHDLWPRELAIRAIHRPQDRADLQHARKRLKWDEAFTMQAALAQRRHGRRRDARGAAAAGRRTGSRPRSTGGCRSRSPRGSGRSARSSPHDLALRVPDEPAAAGRGRLGQDRRRAAGDAPGGRRGRAGRAARADRGARAAALPVDHRAARPAAPQAG